jgi:ketosteroid isomerase-like protein
VVQDKHAGGSPGGVAADGHRAVADGRKDRHAKTRDAYNKRDAAALAAAYAPDALLSSTAWTASGRAAIQEGFAKEFAAVDVKITTINVDQAQRLGDWQHSRGTWAGEIKAPDGKTTPMNGHWLIIGTCQGQTCLIGSHVANTDMPPPPQTSAK